MMSRCPLVTGSKEPGQTTRCTRHHPSAFDEASVIARLPPRIAGIRGRSAGGRGRTRRSLRRTGDSRSGMNPSGQLTGPDRVARSTIDQRPGRQPAGLGEQRQDALPPRRPPARTADRRTRRRSRSPPGPRASTRSTRSATSSAPGSPIASMFSLITADGPGARSTSSTCAGPAREGLEADRARARVQVQHARPVQRARDRGDRGEQPFPGPVAGRPGIPAVRDGQPTAAGLAGDDACHPLSVHAAPASLRSPRS